MSARIWLRLMLGKRFAAFSMSLYSCRISCCGGMPKQAQLTAPLIRLCVLLLYWLFGFDVTLAQVFDF